MKTSYVLLALAIVVIGAGAAFAATTYLRDANQVHESDLPSDELSDTRGTTDGAVSDDSDVDRSAERGDADDSDNRSDDGDNVSDPSGSDSTTMPPIPTGGFTMAEVETHNSEDSCWTVVRGNVYDVTNWVPDHPGGRRAILSLCGTDGTAAFEGQHGGKDGPESRLTEFAIGSLVQP